MNAIEILNKELVGKTIVLYVPIIEGNTIDSLFSIYPDWWERGMKHVEVRRKIAFVLEANGTYRSNGSYKSYFATATAWSNATDSSFEPPPRPIVTP